jgi:hypothetical protein
MDAPNGPIIADQENSKNCVAQEGPDEQQMSAQRSLAAGSRHAHFNQ